MKKIQVNFIDALSLAPGKLINNVSTAKAILAQSLVDNGCQPMQLDYKIHKFSQLKARLTTLDCVNQESSKDDYAVLEPAKALKSLDKNFPPTQNTHLLLLEIRNETILSTIVYYTELAIVVIDLIDTLISREIIEISDIKRGVVEERTAHA